MSEKLEEKLYPEQNPIKLGKYYTDHVMAMTAENLHSKADIAKQLAWRDKKLDAQAAELSALRGFAQSVESIDFTRFNDSAFAQNFVRKTMKLHKLIDENGNPTKLLTGEE